MILVTGHKGFIGSKLFARGGIGYIGLDVRDGLNLLTCSLKELKLQNTKLIYHLAAQSDVVNSWNDPVHDMDNIRMTARLAHEFPYTKIIYANSCASKDPQSPYGFSKWAAGEYLKRFHKNTVNCIFPNIYGPGSRSVVDIFKGTDHVTVYGDGLQTRDYVHVDDIIDGLFKAAAWEPGDYHMGSGKSTMVVELAKDKQITFAPPRQEAREVIVPNTTPDWKPKTDVLEYLYG